MESATREISLGLEALRLSEVKDNETYKLVTCEESDRTESHHQNSAETSEANVSEHHLHENCVSAQTCTVFPNYSGVPCGATNVGHNLHSDEEHLTSFGDSQNPFSSTSQIMDDKDLYRLQDVQSTTMVFGESAPTACSDGLMMPKTCRQEVYRPFYLDDTTVDDLVGYFDQILYLPKPLSDMAELMYT